MKRNNITQFSSALPSIEDSSVWKKRAEEVRESEWTLYRESLEVVHQALDRIRARPFDPITVRDLVKLIEIAFSLGRRATGLPMDGSGYPSTSDADSAWMRHVEQELDRVYGPSPSLNTQLSTLNHNNGSPTSPPPDVPGRDSSPSGPPDNPGNQPPPPTEIVRPEVPINAVPDSGPTQVAPPEGARADNDSTQSAGTEVPPAEAPRPKKHKPYWLNGHYYPNPEFPEAVARAMIANAQRSSLHTRH